MSHSEAMQSEHRASIAQQVANGRRNQRGSGFRRASISLMLTAGVGFFVCDVSVVAWAMHEADHRFTVEGQVCGSSGGPMPQTAVMVKDTRVSLGTTVYTDAKGHYSATLHLHNDNLGDPILVSAINQEQTIKAQFDPRDNKTERKVAVDIGGKCHQDEAEAGTPAWVFWIAGAGVAAVAGFAGVQLVKGRQLRRGQGRGKKKK